MIPHLVHVKGDPMPWQWRAPEPWIDPITKEPTDYLAGFKTRDAALLYGSWQIPQPWKDTTP